MRNIEGNPDNISGLSSVNNGLDGQSHQPTTCDHENPICICNTSDTQRAAFLGEYLDAVADNGWSNIQLMPLGEEGKGPIIEGRCRLESDEAKSLLVDSEDAIQFIKQDGARGFCLYAGKPEHGTTDLVFTDHDELDQFPADANTLTVVSGSGAGNHQTFGNAGDVRNAKGKGELDGAGEVRAHNQYVVLPGSIHPTGGVYHVESNPGIEELKPADLPDELLPSSETPKTQNPEPVVDAEVPDSLRDIGADFNVEKRYQVMLNSTASETVEAIIAGTLSETRFADDRHQAEGWLAEQIGFYMKRDRDVIEQVLTKIFKENPKTDAHAENAKKSSKRKFLQNSRHREQVLNYATSKDSKYDPGLGITRYGREERPEVSYPLFNRVNDALVDLVLARTEEIVEHPRVDRGKRQVQNALRKMQDSDEVPFTVQSVKDGRKRYYYLEGYKLKIPEDRREELGLEVGI